MLFHHGPRRWDPSMRKCVGLQLRRDGRGDQSLAYWRVGISKIAEALGMESNGSNGRVHRLTVLWRRVGWLRQGYGGEKTLPLLLSAGQEECTVC